MIRQPWEPEIALQVLIITQDAAKIWKLISAVFTVPQEPREIYENIRNTENPQRKFKPSTRNTYWLDSSEPIKQSIHFCTDVKAGEQIDRQWEAIYNTFNCTQGWGTTKLYKWNNDLDIQG